MHSRFRFVFLRVVSGFLSSAALLASAPCGAAQGLASSDISRLRSVGSAEISPDDRRIAYTIVMRDRPGRPYGQLWIMDLGTQKSARVGGEKDRAGGPLWSPDGKQLAFAGSIAGKARLLLARTDRPE